MNDFVDIPGYENLYKINKQGVILSCSRYASFTNRLKKQKILNQRTTIKGYKEVKLYKDGKYKIYKVHCLVAVTFIPNPNNYPQINHKDENKANNSVENLEWGTNKYNTDYSNNCIKSAKSRQKSVKIQNTTNKKIIIFLSVKEAIAYLHCSPISIYKYINRPILFKNKYKINYVYNKR